MAEIKKGACQVCPRQDVSVTATGGLRVHAANGKRVGPDNPACAGSGQEPRGTVRDEDVHFLCRVPAGPDGCGKEVVLTANHRARSHLNGQGVPCAGGSDWPVALWPGGFRQDTAPWAEDDWEAALPRPERSGEILPAARPDQLWIEPDGDFDPRPVRDVPLPGPCEHDFTGTDTPDEVSACRMCGLIESDTLPNDPRDDEDRQAAFDLPHDRQPCTHPDGFTYGDDDNGHSGSFCLVCGEPEPEIRHTYDDGAGGVWAHPGLKADCRLAECGNDWHTPDDLLILMPRDVQELARSAPLCWDCGHEVTPLVERFEIDGSVEHVLWACEHGGNCDCAARPTGCRVKGLAQARLSELDEGVLFVRHTARAPLNKLVYRVQGTGDETLTAIVVTPGPYAGKTGKLTNLTEEVTCTDLNGTPRPRPDRGTGVTSPSGPARPSQDRTPSTPRTAPVPASGGSSTPRTSPSAPSAAARSKRVTSSGALDRSTATSTPSATKSGPVPDAFSTPKQAVNESDKYDSYGRYKLLHPDSRKKVNWTRATTFCKSIQDTYALSMWSQRMVLKGSSIRPDLTAAAGTLEVKADKDRMNGLVDEAKKAAGDKIAANKGTAVHAYTEDLDKELVGMPVEPKTVPDEFVPTVQAYQEILASFGLVPVPGLIEFTTAVKQYEVAGTADRVYRVTRDITIKLNGRPVTLYAGEYVIGDVKTGADLSYGWQEIAIQLALYAQGLNTSGVWDWGTRIWSRPEDGNGNQIQVRTDVGIVPHLPVDRSTTGAPLATLYAVDLTAGWAAAVLCGQVRSWRKERTLATPLEIADVVGDPQEVDPDTDVPYADLARSAPVSRPVTASRPVTLRDKAQAVTSRAEASSVYQEAVAARTPVPEVKALVQIMSDKLKSFTEQGA